MAAANPRACELCGGPLGAPAGPSEDRRVCDTCLRTRRVIVQRERDPEADSDRDLEPVARSGGSRVIRFDCPHCRRRLQSKAIARRTEIACPRCGQRFAVLPGGVVETVFSDAATSTPAGAPAPGAALDGPDAPTPRRLPADTVRAVAEAARREAAKNALRRAVPPDRPAARGPGPGPGVRPGAASSPAAERPPPLTRRMRPPSREVGPTPPPVAELTDSGEARAAAAESIAEPPARPLPAGRTSIGKRRPPPEDAFAPSEVAPESGEVASASATRESPAAVALEIAPASRARPSLGLLVAALVIALTLLAGGVAFLSVWRGTGFAVEPPLDAALSRVGDRFARGLDALETRVRRASAGEGAPAPPASDPPADAGPPPVAVPSPAPAGETAPVPEPR